MQGAPRKSTRGRYGPLPHPLPSLSLSLFLVPLPCSCRVARKRVAEDGNKRARVHPRMQCEQFSRLSPPWNLSPRYISFSFFLSFFDSRLAEFNLSCLPSSKKRTLVTPSDDYFPRWSRMSQYPSVGKLGSVNLLTIQILRGKIYLEWNSSPSAILSSIYNLITEE